MHPQSVVRDHLTDKAPTERGLTAQDRVLDDILDIIETVLGARIGSDQPLMEVQMPSRRITHRKHDTASSCKVKSFVESRRAFHKGCSMSCWTSVPA